MLNQKLKIGALTSAMMFAACGGTSPDTYEQIATGRSALMSDPSSGESHTFADLVLAARGDVPAGMTLNGKKLTGTREGLMLEYEIGGADSTDIKLKWTGKVEDERYKFELERSGDWKVVAVDDEDVHIEGTTTLHLKSDFKDRSSDIRHKYDFDSTARYDVFVRKVDGVIVSGKIDEDVHAKEKLNDGSDKVKTDLKVKMTVTFENAEIADIDLDGRYKYRLKLDNGELNDAND